MIVVRVDFDDLLEARGRLGQLHELLFLHLSDARQQLDLLSLDRDVLELRLEHGRQIRRATEPSVQTLEPRQRRKVARVRRHRRAMHFDGALGIVSAVFEHVRELQTHSVRLLDVVLRRERLSPFGRAHPPSRRRFRAPRTRARAP